VVIVYGAGALLSISDPVWKVAAGAAAFSLVEYAVHRWGFHGARRWAPGLYDVIHGAHHRLPDDPGRRVVPLSHSLPIAVVLMLLTSPPVTCGLFLGYLAYEAAHAVAHRRGPLPWGLRQLRRHHARHHHVDDEAAFGVSSPLWDLVFRTMPRRPHPWAVVGDAQDPRPEAL
jgi:sterol desaturase/sphingolipid hydroxylase (fatty acid hydroxylase superfamily)